MFLRSSALDIDLKKYFVSGIINLNYFFNDNDSLREASDINLSLPSILHSLDLSGALTKIKEVYAKDI